MDGNGTSGEPVSSTIDNNGLLTVAPDETAAALRVRAVSVYDPAKEGTVDIAVLKGATFNRVDANGSDSADTTALTLRFDRDIDGLALEDITLSGNGVEPGTAITRTGTGTYTLPVTVTAWGTVTVTVEKSGYIISPPSQTVRVYRLGGPVPGAENMSSIKAKFGITETGTAGVRAAFTALHRFIQAGGLSSSPDVIRLGDWIDLEGGLEVAAYPGTDGNGGGATDPAGAPLQNTDITPNPLPFEDYEGKLFRLIVVGINSFHSGWGEKDAGSTPPVNGDTGGRYTETANDDMPHVVFQFQNIPVQRRMEATNTNQNGYLGSEMRKYLVPVDGDGGNFLSGLANAGVPENVLWAPTRYVANRGKGATGADTITDKLWLPTEREMFGVRTYSVAAYETAANQARLEYYTDDYKRKKYSGGNSEYSYWGASPYAADVSSFCVVGYSGNAYSYCGAGSAGGCAPAFCVR
jgi:hypothetical protein